MNNKKKPFDDVRVRRAIAMADDRKAVIEGRKEGYGKTIGSHMCAGEPLHRPDRDERLRPEKAKCAAEGSRRRDAAQR